VVWGVFEGFSTVTARPSMPPLIDVGDLRGDLRPAVWGQCRHRRSARQAGGHVALRQAWPAASWIRPRSAVFDRKRPAGWRTLTTYGHPSDHLSWVSAS